jgi:hypothetical protein
MAFDDPELRAIAMNRIRVLNQLTEDLIGIVEGNRPTPAELASAVTLHGVTFGERSVPCLVGIAQDHPRLGSQLITTSQLFAADPHGRWARTLSRFYRLEASDGEAQ